MMMTTLQLKLLSGSNIYHQPKPSIKGEGGSAVVKGEHDDHPKKNQCRPTTPV